jgi:hypothetical protein
MTRKEEVISYGEEEKGREERWQEEGREEKEEVSFFFDEKSRAHRAALLSFYAFMRSAAASS